MTDFVSGLRQAIQDLLIPEFRALQTEVRNLGERLDQHAEENARQFQAIHERFDRIDQRFERVDERFERVDQRFERVDQRFEALTREMNQRFEVLTKTVASMDGKLEILVSHIVDYKEVARLSARQDQLEKRLGEVDATLTRILARLPS